MKRLTFAVVCMMAVPILPVRADEAEDEVIELIEELGGTITRDRGAPGEPVVTVNLRDTEAKDTHLKRIAERLKQVSKMDLSGTKVTGAGLKYLSGLERLGELDLSCTKVGGAALRHLAGLENLRKLILYRSAVTDEGPRHLVKLKRLEVLDLQKTKVTDAK